MESKKTLRDYGLMSYGGGIAKYMTGGGRRTLLTDNQLIGHLLEKGVVLSEMQHELGRLKALTLVQDDILSLAQIVEQKIKALDPFRHFFIYKKNFNQAAVIFYRKGRALAPVCSPNDFTPEMVVTFLSEYDKEMINEITETIAKTLSPEGYHNIKDSEVMQKCFNICKPLSTMPVETHIQEPHPAVVEGCQVQASRYIPYSEKKVTFSDLNHYLAEFLSRIENHDNLCANLWTNFIGMKTPVLIYLKGRGGDGKSSFIHFLVGITGSSCNYDNSERFNFFNMYGKSLIILNENKMPNLLQHATLKAVTGGDVLPIEGKNRDAFSGQVRGQIIVAANDPIVTFGTPDEVRRLRYYDIKPPELLEENIMLQEVYQAEFLKTPNEFLNYCRQCYENLKTKTGAVQYPPNHSEIMKRLRSPEAQSDYNAAWKLLTEDYEVQAGASCDRLPIIEKISNSKRAGYRKYFVSNFETIALVDDNIQVHGDKYLNLRKRGPE